nr:reverse transcriptase domain-containing protein [Tanacetum cinerariifolium]
SCSSILILRFFSGKLKTRWSGPFTITEVYSYDTAKLAHADGLNFKVNCHRLKHYYGGDVPPMVTSPVVVEGSMQQTINELTALCTSLQRQHSELLVQFQAQEVEINKLKARVKILEDNQGVIGARSVDDAPIKGRRIDEEEGTTGRVSSDTKKIRMDEGDVAVERTSEDTEEMATVLTSMDAATVLTSRTAKEIPTGSGSIPTAGAKVSTGSDVVPTASPVFATATVVTPYSRRKGKKSW